MTKKEAREYVRRWRLVSEFQAQELRRMSIAEKLRQMDACYRTAVECDLLKKFQAKRRKSEQEVALRWRRLKGLVK